MAQILFQNRLKSENGERNLPLGNEMLMQIFKVKSAFCFRSRLAALDLFSPKQFWNAV